MSLGPKAEKQMARTSLRAISNTRPATAASGFIRGGWRDIGILLSQNQRDPEDGLARAGWTAKRTSYLYTTRKKPQRPPSDLLSRPSASAGNCAHAYSEAELPGRGRGGRCRRGAGRGAFRSPEREQGGARGREVFNSPVMPHELQPVFLNLLPLTSK